MAAFCRRAARLSLSLVYSRALTQQLSVYYYARVRSFIDFPSSLDIILVSFIPIILSDSNLFEALRNNKAIADLYKLFQWSGSFSLDKEL